MGPANPIGGRFWENHQNPRAGRISPLCRGPGRRYHLGLLMALEAVRRPSLLACSKALDAVRRPSSIEAHLMHEFMPLEPYLVFWSKHAQYTTLGLKLKFWMVLRHFVAAPNPLWKLLSWCIKSTRLCLGNHFLFVHDEHAQSKTLGLKILLDTSMHFYIAFDHS